LVQGSPPGGGAPAPPPASSQRGYVNQAQRLSVDYHGLHGTQALDPDKDGDRGHCLADAAFTDGTVVKTRSGDRK